MDESYIGLVLKERYRLLSFLGKGGMGFVMKARDTQTGELYAVKFLKEHITSTNEKRRFQREYQIIYQLKNPHVVKSIDCGEHEHLLYIVMEFVEGQSLSELLDEELGGQVGRGLDPQLVLRLVLDVIVGLSEAHRLGVIHRDLKPDNIMVNYDHEQRLRAKVIDFGVAKPFDDSSGGLMIRDQLTDFNMIIGTPKYMAPEQFLKEPVDHRTDLYAVGILMYLMLSGAAPFQVGNPKVPKEFMQIPEYQILWQHVNLTSEPLSVHPLLWDLISDLLQKDINQRPESTREVMTRLEELMEIIAQSEEVTHRTKDFALTALMEDLPEMAVLRASRPEDPLSTQANRQTQPLHQSDVDTQALNVAHQEPRRARSVSEARRGSVAKRLLVILCSLLIILSVAYGVSGSARQTLRSMYTALLQSISELTSPQTGVGVGSSGGVKIIPKGP